MDCMFFKLRAICPKSQNFYQKSTWARGSRPKSEKQAPFFDFLGFAPATEIFGKKASFGGPKIMSRMAVRLRVVRGGGVEKRFRHCAHPITDTNYTYVEHDFWIMIDTHQRLYVEHKRCMCSSSTSPNVWTSCGCSHVQVLRITSA